MTNRKSRNPDRTGAGYWQSKGFTKAESWAFADITHNSIKAMPYLSKLINHRVRMFNKAMRESDGNKRYAYSLVREEYVKFKVSEKSKGILYNDVYGRTMAFKFLDAYKEKNGERDDEGRLVGTPRAKTKAVSKPKTTKERLIEQSRKEIGRLRDRLKYPESEATKADFKRRIKIQQGRIKELGGK